MVPSPKSQVKRAFFEQPELSPIIVLFSKLTELPTQETGGLVKSASD